MTPTFHRSSAPHSRESCGGPGVELRSRLRWHGVPVAALAAFAVHTGSCGGGSRSTQGAATPSSSVASSTTAGAGSTTATTESKLPPPPFDPPSIHALVSDPALVDVAHAIDKKDWRAAADALGAAI